MGKEKSQSQNHVKELSQATSIIEEDIQEEEEEGEQQIEKKKSNGTRKRAWWWKFYTIKTLTTKYQKGRGKTKELVYDEKYACNICINFSRLASKLSGSNTALSQHIKVYHKRQQDIEESTDSHQARQTRLSRFLKGKDEELPPFEDAIVEWIINTCQPFTVSKTKKFKVMIKSAGHTRKIVKADTISSRVYKKLEVCEKDLIALLERTCSTVALSFDGWTSTNNLSMFAMNGK
jgi:hypothetical protein